MAQKGKKVLTALFFTSSARDSHGIMPRVNYNENESRTVGVSRLDMTLTTKLRPCEWAWPRPMI